MKRIINATIYDYHTFKENQFIEVDKTIIKVGNMKDMSHSDMETIDVKGALLMPGMINAHSHIYSTFARGLSVAFAPQDFKELLEQLWWKLDHYLTNEMTYYSGIAASVEHLKNGVTTIIDHHASGEIKGSLSALKKAVVDHAKMRGIFCFETSDRYDIEECIVENTTFMKSQKTTRTKGLFGLHASFTLSDKTLDIVHKTMQGPIHIHVAESEYDRLHSLQQYQQTPIQRLQTHDLLTPQSLLAHAIHTTNDDWDIIKESSARVVVNVSSNMNNGVGLPDVLGMKNKGIPVLIGNDGISYSMAQEYISLYFAMRHLYQSPTAFTMEHIREMIIDTYKYASEILGVKLGKIKEGYAADFVVVPYQAPTPFTKNNAMGHLLFGVYRQFRPQHVFIAGEQLVNNYQITTELQQEYNRVLASATECWDAIVKEG